MTDPPLDASRFSAVVFFTGAGLSAESGLPTYRGKGGIWDRYDYREIACQDAFEGDPGKVWDYHEWRRDRYGAARPSRAHLLAAAVQRRLPATRVVTQNIDGLHQQAGSTEVIELHGSIWRVRCDAEGRRWEEARRPLPSRRCACGAWLRPDIVWFGDMLDDAVIQAAVAAVRGCDLLVSVGTSATVHPAAQLPLVAREAGAVCVEVNPEETALSPIYDVCLRSGASEGLARLWPDLEPQEPSAASR